MKKNIKIIVFSAIGIAILAVTAVVLSLTAPNSEADEPETTTTTADERLDIVATDTAKIETIKVSNQNGVYTIGKTEHHGATEWTIVGAGINQHLYDQSKFNTIVTNAAQMKANSVVEENADDLAQYGLETPAAQFTTSFSDGTEKTIEIGGINPSGTSLYIKEKGDNTVYTYSNYKLNYFTNYTATSFVLTQVMEAYDSQTAPVITKLTVKRKDMEKDVVLEALPEPDENSDSINVYSHTFTSPFNCYIDFNDGPAYLYGLYGLNAKSAAYLEVNDETKGKTGLLDPQCEVAMLVEDTIYRLYIGNAVEETVIDEATGVETTSVVAYYGICNQVPDVIYLFDAASLPWITNPPEDFASEMFLVPYIFDLESIAYEDAETSFEIRIEGTNESNAFYNNETNEKVDGDSFKELYQYFISAKGDSFYDSEDRGEKIASITYNYENESMEPSVVEFFEGVESREVIIAVNGVNLYTTKPMYTVRLLENAQAFLNGEEIVLSY